MSPQGHRNLCLPVQKISLASKLPLWAEQQVDQTKWGVLGALGASWSCCAEGWQL